MGECKNCKWWRSNSRSEVGDCNLAESDNNNPIHPESKAIVYSFWSDYGGRLQTDPDFGCNQFEESNGS